MHWLTIAPEIQIIVKKIFINYLSSDIISVYYSINLNIIIINLLLRSYYCTYVKATKIRIYLFCCFRLTLVNTGNGFFIIPNSHVSALFQLFGIQLILLLSTDFMRDNDKFLNKIQSDNFQSNDLINMLFKQQAIILFVSLERTYFSVNGSVLESRG